ncbi:hypothetical protein [Nocardia abscessus]|nr:hypothetical protein [Nocardia abscessus]
MPASSASSSLLAVFHASEAAHTASSSPFGQVVPATQASHCNPSGR